MKTLLLFTIAISLFAQDKTPELTDKQKIQIREAQVNLLSVEAEKATLESRLKDLNQSLPVAQRQLQEALRAVAPKGYTVQNDLTLKKDPEVAPPAAPPATK